MQKPVAVYGVTPGRMDVFWCAGDKSSVMHTWLDGSGGSDWQTEIIGQSNIPFGPAPAAYSDQPGKMDVGWTDWDGKLWYAKFDGGQWTTPTELNPENMGGVFWVPSSGSIVGPPTYFASNSPLIACPNPSNRRSQNTEFLVCDSEKNICDLLFDNGTWKVSKWKLDDQMAFAPVQVMAQIGPGTTSPQPHIFWCDKDGKLRFSYTLSRDAAPNAPVSICQNKFFETTRSSPLFSAADFWSSDNANGLITVMRAEPGPGGKVRQDPLSAYIWPLIRNQIPRDQYGRIIEDQAGDALASEFNRLCGGPSLYDKTRFAEVALRKETRVLLAQNPQQGDDLRRLNRLLLEDGYNGYIARCLSYMGGLGFEPVVLAGLTPGRVDIFWYSTSRKVVMQSVWNGSSWSHNMIKDHYVPESGFTPVTGFAPGRVDLLCLRESDDTSGKMDLDDISSNGQDGWGTTTIATDLSLDNLPAAIYNPVQERLHVFWVSADSKLWNILSDGINWSHPPTVVGTGPRLPAPKPVQGYRPGRIDVIWGGIDRELKQARWNGTTWDSVRLNPGHLSSAAAVPCWPASQITAGNLPLEFAWTDNTGALLFEWFDGHWHIKQIAGPNSVKSPPVFRWYMPTAQGNLVGWARYVYWVNSNNQLCEAYLPPPPPGTDWSVGTSPGADWTVSTINLSPKFSSRFAPVLMTFMTADWAPIQLYLFDTDDNLWQVTFNDTLNATPPYSGTKLPLGPMAYAPTVMNVMRSPQGDTIMVFWVSKEDLSLKHSWLTWGSLDTNWHTLTIDPGPITSPPAIYYWGMWARIFWTAPDGSLHYTAACVRDMCEKYYSANWHTEIIDPGPVCSDLSAIQNAQGQISVFWLDATGELKQISKNPPWDDSYPRYDPDPSYNTYNPNAPWINTGWRKATIAPARLDGANWRDL